MIRQILNYCITCKRDGETPQHLLMGDLPKNRVESGGEPFRNTGVDYFGPYVVKRSTKTRSNTGLVKRYGVSFTCRKTRATHIELARDLSTDSLLLALWEFISRRGHIQAMQLENGINFVIANNELKLWIKQLDQSKLNHFSNNQNIEYISVKKRSTYEGNNIPFKPLKKCFGSHWFVSIYPSCQFTKNGHPSHVTLKLETSL